MSSPTPPSTPDPSSAGPTGSFLAELRSSERANEPAAFTPTRRRHIPLHLVVCAGVLVLGCAALLGMRRIGMKAGMTFETDAAFLPVDTATSSKDSQRLASVMADLEHSQSPDAFSHERPEKNPFSLAAVAPKQIEPQRDAAKELAERQAEERRRREEQLESTLGAMRLNGIVGGRGTYIASIGEKTYRVGDVIDELFTVTEIDGRSVTVAADDQLYQLTIGQQTAKPVGKASARPGAKPPATRPAARPASKPATNPAR